MAEGHAGGAWGPDIPLLRDYWLDEPHGPCPGGCGFLLHGLFGLYMADPVPGEPPTELDKVIAHMFEARFTASFALDDLYEFAGDPDTHPNHYKVKAAIQRAPIEIARFGEMVGRFRKGLGPGQGSAMRAMDPVAKKIHALGEAMAPLRNHAAHPGRRRRARPGPQPGGPGQDPAASSGSGVHGIASRAGRTADEEPELEDKVIKSAHLIAMYADCAMHQFPGRFRAALSRATVGDLAASLPDPMSWPDDVSRFKRENPIAPIMLDRVGVKEAPLMSELLRIRNALQVVPAVQAHLNRISLGTAQMPRLWVMVQHRKMACHEQYAALETINFFDLYEKIKRAGLVGNDDNVIGLLNRHEEEIRALRQLVAHWEAGRDFVTEVNEGIGHKRLLLVAALVGEWARINGNEYTERRGLDDIPELDQMNRRLALGRIEHEVSLMREEARSRGAGTPGPACLP
ncbi:MAG: hypothetical protein EB824_02860 [Thaumarchaeota archaeon S15]|nr:hypothetical protein [Nitrososphaerota archaeon]RNJ74813.1 MAG: hypothetical protein EB824_02860 [Thaumarchaeota archaeon S15]